MCVKITCPNICDHVRLFFYDNTLTRRSPIVTTFKHTHIKEKKVEKKKLNYVCF